MTSGLHNQFFEHECLHKLLYLSCNYSCTATQQLSIYKSAKSKSKISKKCNTEEKTYFVLVPVILNCFEEVFIINIFQFVQN